MSANRGEGTGRFAGKNAFITGGAVGLGRAFARALVAEGAGVAIADIDTDAARATAAQLDPTGVRAVAIDCDVADEHRVDRAVATAVAELGGIDILINNAGLHLLKYNRPLGALPRAELRNLLKVNVIGVVNCTLACRESMISRGGGAVLNISSIAGYQSLNAYGVSKLAVRGLTVALAAELAADRIRVNGIAPGLLNTENALADLPDELIDDFVHQRQLVHRIGTVDDVVATMLFLCSAESSFITGETLKVSGGYPLGF